MDINAYIASGVLELYVAGTLSEKENQEVYELMQKYPEVLQEVLEIEDAVLKLTASTSLNLNSNLFQSIAAHFKSIEQDSKVISMTKPKQNWFAYSGWAAAIIVGAGLLWMMNQNTTLESKITTVEIENGILETQIEDAKYDVAKTKELLNIIRDKDIISIPLNGQGEFANTYAKVYWNKDTNSIYLDAQGLPDAPDGKVYQVWSLTLNPLTPTSLGTIDDFNTDDNKIFTIENLNESQAFGITLEPAGGSATPTMEQLYTLGVLSQS